MAGPLDTDSQVREHADVAELTGLLALPGWPEPMRVIVRRQRPHPGRSCPCSRTRTGGATRPSPPTPASAAGVPGGPAPSPARVEDRIRQAEHTGLGRLPSREYAINQAWLACVTLVADLTAWLRLLALPDNLRSCEPKALRYRLLHSPPASPEAPASDNCEYRNPGRGPSTSWAPSPE